MSQIIWVKEFGTRVVSYDIDFEKFERLYLENYSADRTEIRYGGKVSVPFAFVAID